MMRLQILLWTVLIAGASAVLFQVSQEVKGLDRNLASLNRQILTEQEAIRVLRAEWAYLNQPVRLQALASEHLDLAEVSRTQMIASIEDIPRPLPTVRLASAPADGRYANAVVPYPVRKPGEEPPEQVATSSSSSASTASAAPGPVSDSAPPPSTAAAASHAMVNDSLPSSGPQEPAAAGLAVPLPPRPAPRPAPRVAQQEAVAAAPAPASASRPSASGPSAPAATGSPVDLVLAGLRDRHSGEVVR